MVVIPPFRKNRNFLYMLGVGVGAIAVGACKASGENSATPSTGSFELPPLPYAYMMP